ncbi:PilZ domain-containing protein [Desulfobacter curvatus]|uniref:PilZ domain-containing protein n=1 Tax=Desulfobacter curvatus TaxID=2290 RepID=UPI000365E7EB|nr:PilZ domain-containing protein [Desulfobacter curvatus]
MFGSKSDPDTLENIMRRADSALYTAKNKGIFNLDYLQRTFKLINLFSYASMNQKKEGKMTSQKVYQNSSDWRNSKRLDCEVPVDIFFKGKLYRGTSVNISETGIFIKSIPLDDFKIFDKLTITFQRPDLKPVKEVGRVARKTNEGIGILYLGENHPKASWLRPNIEDLFIS